MSSRKAPDVVDVPATSRFRFLSPVFVSNFPFLPSRFYLQFPISIF
jgi:hypothetical protein